MSGLKPFYEESQSIYDLSAEFFALLDIGRGWDTTLERALTKYDVNVNVIGITLSRN